jgi:hypothetical protein
MDTTEHGPEDDLTDLERRLARWRPAAVGLDRDGMLFEAGRAAARAEVRAWTGLASSAALALVAAGLGVLLVRERVQRQALEVRIAQQISTPKASSPGLPAPAAPPIVAQPPSPDSYLALTHRLQTAGLDEALAPGSGTPPDRSPAVPEPTLRVRDVGGLLKL